jgi:folate-dependent phosphoribosylglycinamide formyltransferase PurN
MARPDLLVMSGSKLRHKHFAAELLKAFPGAVSLIETDLEDSALTYVKEPSPVIREHFRGFEDAERRFFAERVRENEALLRSRVVKQIPGGTINDPETVEFVRSLDPKVIAIHSTGLIKEALIEAFPRRLINLHAGLSPYYRGSGTNVWPFYNRELQHVGMTIHYIDVGIDSGDIILQGRPRFEESDDTHTIGCKNVMLGAELMRRVVERCLREGSPPAVKQDTSRGRLYLKKQFTDEVVLSIREFIASGGVREYARAPREAEIVAW